MADFIHAKADELKEKDRAFVTARASNCNTLPITIRNRLCLSFA